jgi:antitoxin (DNA-binding transcriptional repressor) of toxin-antitoxin stability system
MRGEFDRYLAEVQEGRTVTVTDHGRPITRIVPVDGPSGLERLIAEGRVSPAGQRKRPAPTPSRPARPAGNCVGSADAGVALAGAARVKA